MENGRDLHPAGAEVREALDAPEQERVPRRHDLARVVRGQSPDVTKWLPFSFDWNR